MSAPKFTPGPYFTPGPWYVASGVHPVPQVIGPSRKTVAVCGLDANGHVEDKSGPDAMPGSESDANARLIAAAPDLYAACKAVEAFVPEDAMVYSEGTHGERVYVRDLLRAALRKAEGAT